MKSKKRTNKSKAPAIADFGLNIDDEMIQFIGDPTKMMEGVEPKLRAMTLDDIDDDCPACRANRKRILAGDPPMAYVFE